MGFYFSNISSWGLAHLCKYFIRNDLPSDVMFDNTSLVE